MSEKTFRAHRTTIIAWELPVYRTDALCYLFKIKGLFIESFNKINSNVMRHFRTAGINVASHLSMKFAALAIISTLGSLLGLLPGSSLSGWGQTFPSAPNPEPSPQGIGKLFNQPGTNPNGANYSGQFHFYPDSDKENQFTVAPAPITDPDVTVQTHPGAQSALSLQNQSNIGLGFSIPVVGLATSRGPEAEGANRSNEIGAGHAGTH